MSRHMDGLPYVFEKLTFGYIILKCVTCRFVLSSVHVPVHHMHILLACTYRRRFIRRK